MLIRIRPKCFSLKIFHTDPGADPEYARGIILSQGLGIHQRDGWGQGDVGYLA